MDILYHASERQDLTLFTPRRYWHSPSFGRSGRLAEGAEPPEGMSAIRAFYTETWDGVAFYYAPIKLPRLQLYVRKHGAAALAGFKALGYSPGDVPNGRMMVFEEEDQARLRAHRFSIYAFHPEKFRRLPSAEYIAEEPVVPCSETKLGDAIAALEARGIVVHLAHDIAASYRELHEAGIKFDTEGLLPPDEL